MKYKKVFRILALIFSLLILALPATPALAAAGITLSQSCGPAGSTITVTGSDFAGNTAGYLWFDNNGSGTMDGNEIPVLLTTTSSGTIPETTLTIPSVTAGNYYYVRVDLPSDGTAEASASFLVTTRSITLSSTSGYVGDTVTINGAGFAASSSITIYFDSTSVGTATTIASCAFSTTFTIPDSYKGNHTVKAQETSTPANYVTTTFAVSPKVMVNPTSGATGDTVTINGTGFAASSSIAIYFDSTGVGTATTDATGSFASTTFTIPSVFRGSYTVKAQDASSNYATIIFTIGQKITIIPASGAPGTTVTVNGTGFGASSSVTIKYNAVPVTTNPTVITTDSYGGFTASFTVPVGLAGTYAVEASDETYIASANFAMTTNITLSTITSEASPGHVGTEITVSGAGFQPDSPINITYATTPTVVATTTSDNMGAFSATFAVPKSAHGTHTITASDGTNSLQATFFMESVAPVTSELLLPASGEKTKSRAVFDWGDVEDDSEPITYDLQIASDANFTRMLVEKTGLTTSGYTLLDAEKLEPTGEEAPYYWRVRAVDAASNASGWSSSSTFYIGSSWVLYFLIVVGVLFVFFLGFVVGRKSKRSYY